MGKNLLSVATNVYSESIKRFSCQINMTKFTLLRRTCQQAAALVIAREDRDLKLNDAMALRLHMLACKACPHFEQQVLTLRAAMGKWRNYSGQDDV